MSDYTQERRKEHTDMVQQIMVLKPGSTVAAIKEALLEVTGHNFDWFYVNKLVRKVKNERKVRFSKAEVGKRLAEIEDQTRLIKTKMWGIMQDKKATDIAKIRAGEAIVKAEKILLDAQMDAGIFERKPGVIEIDTTEENEKFMPMLQAFRNFKRLPEVREVEVIDVTPKALNATNNRTTKRK